MQKYIRIQDLTEKYGMARSTVYYWMRKRGFPKPIKIGERRVVWSVDDVERWIEKCREKNALK